MPNYKGTGAARRAIFGPYRKRYSSSLKKAKGPIGALSFILKHARSQAIPGLPATPLIFGVFGAEALMVFL